MRISILLFFVCILFVSCSEEEISENQAQSKKNEINSNFNVISKNDDKFTIINQNINDKSKLYSIMKYESISKGVDINVIFIGDTINPYVSVKKLDPNDLTKFSVIKHVEFDDLTKEFVLILIEPIIKYSYSNPELRQYDFINNKYILKIHNMSKNDWINNNNINESEENKVWVYAKDRIGSFARIGRYAAKALGCSNPMLIVVKTADMFREFMQFASLSIYENTQHIIKDIEKIIDLLENQRRGKILGAIEYFQDNLEFYKEGRINKIEVSALNRTIEDNIVLSYQILNEFDFADTKPFNKAFTESDDFDDCIDLLKIRLNDFSNNLNLALVSLNMNLLANETKYMLIPNTDMKLIKSRIEKLKDRVKNLYLFNQSIYNIILQSSDSLSKSWYEIFEKNIDEAKSEIKSIADKAYEKNNYLLSAFNLKLNASLARLKSVDYLKGNELTFLIDLDEESNIKRIDLLYRN